MQLTDPAKELAETLAKIADQPTQSIVDRIASGAQVAPWSPALFRIIFEILNRMDLVLEKTAELPMDDDIKRDAITAIKQMKAVFNNQKILSQNNEQLRPILSGSNATVLRMLSMMIREKVAYPLLDHAQRQEVIEQVETLRDWLLELQSDDRDFIRQALIDGLESFLFRLERLEWFGHGYVIDGLKEVIEAYLILEGVKASNPDGSEIIDAMLIKSKAAIFRVLQVFDFAKDNTDRIDWALKSYGALSAVADGTKTISGLLAS